MYFNEKGELILDSKEKARFEWLQNNNDESELLSLILMNKVITEPWVEGRFKTKRAAQARIRKLQKAGIHAEAVKEKSRLKKVMK